MTQSDDPLDKETNNHIIEIYGKDGTTEESSSRSLKLQRKIQGELLTLGRVPWIIGVDWKQEAEQVTLTWEIGGEIARTGSATHEHGRELDWFMVSRAIRGNSAMWRETEQPLQGHTPIWISIPSSRYLDLGSRIVTPKNIDSTGKDQNSKERPWDPMEERSNRTMGQSRQKSGY